MATGGLNDDFELESPLFTFHLSGDVSLPLRVKISSLEGDLQRLNKEICTKFGASVEPLWNTQSIQVVAQLFADDMPLGPASSSNYSTLISNTLVWNEVIEFPIQIKNLPLTSRLVFTLKHIIGPRLVADLGSTSVELFTKKLTLIHGRQKLFVWPGRPGDGSFDSSTPGKRSTASEMDQIEKRLKKFDAKEIERVDWLDKFVGKAIEAVQEKNAASPDLALFVAFPDFNNPIVFHQQAINQESRPLASDSVFVVVDYESSSNPAEDKHLMISRAKKGGLVEQDLKPNSDEKNLLETIVAYPPTRHLQGDEKELIWRFRFWLQSNKKALTKFLKSVDWNKPSEEKEALKLMEKWEPIDTVDALELLSFHFKENALVRSYAVKRLYRAEDKELQDYLLQLVQALRYDAPESTSDLAIFLMQKSIVSLEIGCQVLWYFSIEKANPQYRSILVEILKSLEGLPEGQELIKYHQAQKKAVKSLAQISKKLKELGTSATREKKAELVREWLKEGKYPDLTAIEWMPLPIDPAYKTNGIKEEVSVFKSALAPLRIVFKVDAPHYGKNEFSVIFKVGDDLRQDQLVVQLFSLMDRLLKKENLDLNIITYRVLATSKNHGMVEMVLSSKNVATVLEEYPGDPKALQSFLRANHPDKNGPYGIDKDAFERFIRSNAGYCVITYILGVGDRHLDNLLIAKSGELFHIDYGFIMGRDPRPFPPPMKLSPQMVEAMGGQGSEHFLRFKSYCCTAFNILRKSSNLILNLVSLVIDAEIGPSIHGEQSILKVQEKFKLELTDEQAVEAFQQLIVDSSRAFAPQVTDTFHRWAQYWRD